MLYISTLYIDDLSDNPTGHDSTVSHDGADDDNTPFIVHHKRRKNYNAVFGRKKNDKFKRGLQKHNIYSYLTFQVMSPKKRLRHI